MTTQNLSFIIGNTFKLNLALKNQDGTDYDTTGEVWQLSIKQKRSDATFLLNPLAGTINSSVVSWEIDEIMTNNWLEKDYFYSITRLKSGDLQTILGGTFKIRNYIENFDQNIYNFVLTNGEINFDLQVLTADIIIGGGGGGGETNLSYTSSATQGVVVSNTGTDATIPAASGTLAGLLLPAEKTKLSGIAEGAEVNVNADWNAMSGDAQILNKPTIPTSHTELTEIGTNTHAQIDTAMTRLANTSGTNTGDETTNSIKSKLGITTLSGANTGDQDLSSYALNSSVPTQLSQLAEDTTHRLTTDAEKSIWNAKQSVLGFTPENSANKNQNNGYAGLDAGGKISQSQLPPIAITETFVVNNQTEMLALAAQVGDVAIRNDLNKTFILSTEPANTLGNWLELKTPTGTVSSVFGRTGAITAQNNDYSASQITNTPAGNISSITVQTALNELDNEKENVISPGTTSQYFRGDKTFQTLDKIAVGLANVDNTSDADKPISTATQTALDTKQNSLGFTPENIVNKNQPNGYLGLNNNGKIDYSVLPNHNDFAGIQGGTTDEYYHLTNAQLTILANTSGTNTGDQTTIVGNAGSATVLQTARNINGISFDGSQNITIFDDTKLAKAGDTITGNIGNSSTGFLRMPNGTTLQRPISPENGMVRYNTDSLRNEFYSNGGWRKYARLEGDNFTGAISAPNISGINTGDYIKSAKKEFSVFPTTTINVVGPATSIYSVSHSFPALVNTSLRGSLNQARQTTSASASQSCGFANTTNFIYRAFKPGVVNISFNLGTAINGHRCFVGLSNTTNSDFNGTDTGINCVGIGFGTGDTTGWYLYNNDGTGNPTKTLIDGMSRNTTDIINLIIGWSSLDFNINVYTTDNNGFTTQYLTNNFISTNIPDGTLALGYRIGIGTGSVAQAAIINLFHINGYETYSSYNFSC